MTCSLRLQLTFASTALLGACAAQEPFPSLSPRAAEYELAGQPVPPCVGGSAAGGIPAGSTAVQSPPDAQLGAELARLLDQARRGQAEFDKLLPGARTRVARAGSSGSDAWVTAQQDVSRLEAARAPTVDALAALEALVLARSNLGGYEADRLSAIAAADEVRRLAEGQQAEIDRLSGSLSGGSARRNEPLPAQRNAQRPLGGRQALAASGRGHISPAAPPKAAPTESACRG
jgi:hypothetical protein